jgi:hypothetical protein
MKRIYSSPDLAAVKHLKDLLDSAGIACFMKNDISSYLCGDIAMSGIVPEVWIDDEARLAEALQIKKDWLAPEPIQGTPWPCPKCGEKIEAQFDSCWKCGTARPK